MASPGLPVLVFIHIFWAADDTSRGGKSEAGKEMESTLGDAQSWAERQFGGADLGDARSTRRLVSVATQLAKEPSGSLHRAISGWSELVGAYRLLSRPETTFEAIVGPHQQRTREACSQPGEYLLIEDTTCLDYTTHNATEGLGRIGDDRGRGLNLHSNLALCIEGWEKSGPRCSVVGFFHQKCWARTGPSIGHGKERKPRRLKRKRESQRWGEAYEWVDAPPPGIRWTHVGDRETDIYEVFERCEAKGLDWIVRACQARALADEAGSVFTVVEGAAKLGHFELELRARPQQAARVARLDVRAVTVNIRSPWRPAQEPGQMALNVVEVREQKSTAQEEPLHWVLLTTWPVGNFEEAMRVVGAYACRPIIEEFHRALKSGVTDVEESQLETAHALQALTAILSPVALRLLCIRGAAIGNPETELPAGEMDPLALQLLETAHGQRVRKWTYALLIVTIAQLGGFKARTNDGMPGWNTIWRGWYKLMVMVEGVELFKRLRGT